MSNLFPIIIPVLCIFLYTILTAIESAAALSHWHPEWFPSTLSVSAVSETTTVFLALGLVSFIAFFPGAVAVWGPLMIISAFIFLTVQAIRIFSMLIIIFRQQASSFLKGLFACLTIFTPALLFGVTAPIFLLGNRAFSHAGLLLGESIACMTLFITLLLTLQFLALNTKHEKKSAIIEHSQYGLVTLLVLAMMVVAFALSKAHAYAWHLHAITGPFLLLMAVLLYMILSLQKHQHFQWWAMVAAMACIAGAGLIASLPYIVYPTVTIASSIATPAMVSLFSWVCLIGTIIIVPLLYILYITFL